VTRFSRTRGVFPNAVVMSEWMPAMAALSSTGARGDGRGVSLGERPHRRETCDAPWRRASGAGRIRWVLVPHSLDRILRETARKLAEAGVPDPVVDAELIAAHVLG